MDLGLTNKTALVTASSKGLGRASAMALAAEGVKVVITGRNLETLQGTEAEIRAAGGEVTAIQGDVTEPDAPEALVAATFSRYGGLDILVANAGGPKPAKALDLDDEAILGAVNANLLTSVRLVRHAVPLMRAPGWGRIVLITSSSIKQPIPTLSLSNTARTGLYAWAKTAAADLVADGITLNLACPGLHATDRMKELGTTGRMGDPADFGAMVASLCSAQAGFVTGHALLVDGGTTLGL